MQPNPDEILSSLLMSPPESRTEQLQTLLRLSSQSPQMFSDSLRRTFSILQITLTDPLVEISLLSTNLISSLLTSYRDDLEPFISEVLPGLITNLGDSQPVLRKASHSTLLAYLRATGNFDQVVKAFVDTGVAHIEWQVRQKSINSFQSLFLSEGRLVKWESLSIRRLVEALIERTADSNPTVAKASEQALLSLNTSEGFKALIRILPKNKLESLNLLLDGYKVKPKEPGVLLTHSTPVKEITQTSANITPKSYNFMSIASNLLETTSTPDNLEKRKLLSMHREKNDIDLHLQKETTLQKPSMLKSPIAQKMYGVFSSKLIGDLSDDRDWQVRSNAIEELEKQMEEIDLKSSDFLPHLHSFLQLLLRLLGDSNFKICLTTVNLLSKLLIFKETRSKSTLESLYPRLLEKLGDSKIAIRQASIRIIKELFESSSSQQLPTAFWLDFLMPGFDSPNQHLREETLNLLSFFLSKSSCEEASYERFLQMALRFLEDPKPKVQAAAWEAIGNVERRMSRERFEQVLQRNLTNEGYEMVVGRMPCRTPPVVKEGGKRGNTGNDVSTSCSSRSFQETKGLTGNTGAKKEEAGEKRTLSAFSLKASNLSEELEKICEKEESPAGKGTFEEKKKAGGEKIGRRTGKKMITASNSVKEPHEEKKAEGLMVQSKEYQKKNESEKESPWRENQNLAGKSNFEYKKATYLEKDELEPLKQPETALKTALQDIKTDDWSKQFESLNTIRRVILFHSDVLQTNSNLLHSLALDLLRLVESLRSSLSKNAMLAATELVERLKKQLDSEADLLLSRLMRKGLDSSAFIAEEVKRGLIAVSTNCSDSKVVPILLSMTNTKAAQAKLNLLICYEALVKKSGARFTAMKDHDKLLSSLVSFMFDGANEVRTVAKGVFLMLINEFFDRSEIDRLLFRVLQDQQYQKVQLLLEKETRGGKETISTTMTTSMKKPPFGTYTKLKKSTTPDNTRLTNNNATEYNSTIEINNFLKEKEVKKIPKPPSTANNRLLNLSKGKAMDSELFNSLIGQCGGSGDWKAKLESINKLVEFVEKNLEEVNKPKYASSLADAFMKMVLDSNAKVSLQAIQSFTELVPGLILAVENNLVNILNSVFNVLASFNNGIKTAAGELLDAIIENMEDKSVLVQPLCNGALFAVSKARGTILMKLTNLIERVYEEKPNVVQKYVCSLVVKMLDDGKNELRNEKTRFLQKIYEVFGEELFKNVPGNKVQMIMEILKK